MQSILLRLATSSALAIVLVMLAGCGVQSDDTLGHAYVAPATLALRRELREKNSTVALLKHGERVSILDVHRRFVKVRTDKGVVGWLDSLELLSADQMAQIKKEREQMARLPSEGMATVYDALNVHIEPNRQSPAFAKVPEGGSVTVLGQRVAPKVTGPVRIPTLIVPKPEPTRRHGRKKSPKNAFHLPPKPAPPKPPADWRTLPDEPGGAGVPHAESATQKGKKSDEKAPVILENWSSIRTKNGGYGWVLSRNLMMSIPDDVAQYAEGKRITSYFDLGVVHDAAKGERHNWLWTTLSATAPYDFDSWRVFLWNQRRHRYETSFRARDLVGYFPVHVDPAETGVPGRRFELIVKDEDGVLRRKSYQFDGVRVHLTGTEDYHPEAETKANEPQQAKSQRPSGWLGREWLALQQMFAKYRK
jgi:SH3-like domain-containing protein